MRYEEIVQKIKESPILLIGIGRELQVDAGILGVEADTAEYAERLNRFIEQDEKKLLVPYKEAYETLKELTENKNYFIVTTNTDGMLERMGFQPERIVSPCGSVHRMQCENLEHGVWENSAECPVCGKRGVLNIVKNKPYNENGYLKQWEGYTGWLQKTINRNIFILELGEGFETPTVIRWPFEKIAFINQKAVFARVNSRLPQISEEIKERAFSVNEDSMQFLGKISQLLNM